MIIDYYFSKYLIISLLLNILHSRETIFFSRYHGYRCEILNSIKGCVTVLVKLLDKKAVNKKATMISIRELPWII